MVRGHAKEQAQKKNAARQKVEKGSQLGQAQKKLQVICPVCRASMVNHKLLVQHYESKHPKDTCPPVESFQ